VMKPHDEKNTRQPSRMNQRNCRGHHND